MQLHQKRSIRQGEGQIESSVGDGAGGIGGFKQESHHGNAGEDVTCQYDEGYLRAAGFHQIMVTWPGRNQMVKQKSDDHILCLLISHLESTHALP